MAKAATTCPNKYPCVLKNHSSSLRHFFFFPPYAREKNATIIIAIYDDKECDGAPRTVPTYRAQPHILATQTS